MALWMVSLFYAEQLILQNFSNIPPVMTTLRNTAIGLLRWAGHTNIAAACRRLAAQPMQALALIGIAFEN